MAFLDELDTHRSHPDGTAGGKIERVKGVLASKNNDEVDAFVLEQRMVFANNIYLWLDSNICGADSNTRNLKEYLRGGVAFLPIFHYSLRPAPMFFLIDALFHST